jgi:hypothetical protein
LSPAAQLQTSRRRLGHEQRWVAWVLAIGCVTREHLDPPPLAEHLLVAAGLDVLRAKRDVFQLGHERLDATGGVVAGGAAG